jgi:hypothetical protein
MSQTIWLRSLIFIPCPPILLWLFASEDKVAVSLGNLGAFNQVEGFVFAVDVVRFYGAFPQDEDRNDDDGNEQRAVETSKEVVC